MVPIDTAVVAFLLSLGPCTGGVWAEPVGATETPVARQIVSPASVPPTPARVAGRVVDPNGGITG
jgi:hypothetical protein